MSTTPSIALEEVKSSQIAAIGHDPQTSTLAIRFKNWKGEPTSLYCYDNVSAEDYQAFKTAESVSKHFSKHIKAHADRYPFRRVEDRPVAAEGDRA